MGNSNEQEDELNQQEDDDDADDYVDWEPKEEEPLDLSALPEKLLQRIVRKLDYKDYSQLEETSRSMVTALGNRDLSLPHYSPHTIFVNKKTIKISYHWYYEEVLRMRRIPWHVATTKGRPVRIQAEFVEICCRATSGRMKAVIKLFEGNKTTADNLIVRERVAFEPDDLHRLLTALKVKEFECKQFLPREFFMNPDDGLNKVKTVTLHINGCTDEELLKLKVPCLKMKNNFITDRGLSRLLKQWKKGGQLFYWFHLDFDGTAGTRNFDRILEGTDANPIWTPDMHEYSLVRTLKLEDFALMETDDPEHLYSIWGVDSPEDRRLLSLKQSCFEISGFKTEPRVLCAYLNFDRFHRAIERCKKCGTEFCAHWRRHSIQRLKRNCPQVYNVVIRGIKVAGRVFLAARCCQLLLGATPLRSLLPKDEFKRMNFEEDADLSLFNMIFNLRVYFLNQ